MISYWWNLNSAFHVSPAPWSGEVGEVAGRNAISAKTGKAVHQREGGKRDTGKRQRLREGGKKDRIEAKKEIRKTVS
jgi:hypothetical protein